MKRIFTSLFFLLITSISFAQIQAKGSIAKAGTKMALNDCVVYVSGVETPFFSLEGGNFLLDLPKADTYTLTISKMGYDTWVKEMYIESSTMINVELFAIGTSPEQKNKKVITDEVIVTATRATDVNPTTFTTVDKEDLEKQNLGQDITYLLDQTPSVVVSSDAGAGVGYTNMRIRGSDASRINFTINGIPYNDPESQGVFLVNMPDFTSSIQDIQIQRGVGTSTNGAGAFGASVNINTQKLSKKPYAEFNNSIGSFTTHKHTLMFGTGLIKKHFTFDGRLSSINSDGYIDRASSNLKSYYMSVGFYDKNTIMRFTHFSGKEITYQAWDGVDAETLESNRTFNGVGTDYGARETPYKNEVDNYKQDHYQFHIAQGFATLWNANVSAFLIKGKGYFEQYKVGADFADYQLENQIIGGDTITSTNLIRRRWLDNNYYGFTYALNYEKAQKGTFTLGGGWNQYDGDHFGKVIWAKNMSNGDINHRYYDNNGLKTDFNIFVKGTYFLTSKLIAYADLQFRRVSYTVDGIDNDLRTLYNDDDMNFFNPKVGLTYQLNKNAQVYGSYAMANREPTRNDFIDAPNGNVPEHETLHDVELGYRMAKKGMRLGANYYYMHYKNQLVLTGELNDVGSAIRTNVDKSFRTGIELQAGMDIAEIISFDANMTWSINEIKEFEEVDYLGNVTAHDNTKISYSPQWIGGLTTRIRPMKGIELAISNKFVGEQFMDNANTEAVALKKFRYSNINMSYTTSTKFMREIQFSLLVNNFTNRKYESNGYTFWGTPYYYPQAGANFMVGLNLRF
ncbi:MAG: TonB-dependent receptor [Chitinophagales bacterium]